MKIPESSSVRVRGTLSCQAVDRQALLYFFNGLPQGRRENVRRHLDGCARCRSKLDAFAKIWFLDSERRRTAQE